jgi:hypothetical protein
MLRFPLQFRILAGALLALLALGGCVRRRMTIVSNPPGALVYVDNQQIGTTPVSTNFTYYGTRNVMLVKDGYETLTVKHNFEAPWYQVPPLDFVSENITPQEERDERTLDFTLVPQQMLPVDQIWRNAENLRRSAQQGYVVPLPAGPVVAPPAAGPVMGPEVLPAPPPALNGPVGDAGRRNPWG